MTWTARLAALRRARFAAEALEKRGNQIGQTLLMVGIGIDLSLRRQFIDNFRKVFSQKMRGLVGIDPKFCGERADLLGPEHFLDLIAGDRLVLIDTHPGRESVSLAGLREFVHQPLEAAALLEQPAQDADERIGTAGSFSLFVYSAEY